MPLFKTFKQIVKWCIPHGIWLINFLREYKNDTKLSV
jgi:hypothetical protein